MNKQLSLLSIILSTLIVPNLVHAEIYKHVDSEGRVTYSNVKLKGAKKLDLEPADTNFGSGGSEANRSTNRAPQAKTATPANFPKVDAGTQNQRDGKRKDILQAELEAEKQALAKAKEAYAEGESKPEVYKAANGKTFRNVAKFEEKMKALKDDVDVHQRNIELLTKEINAIN
ncbi:DUF4124 domain-containing protein [Methylotenera versatilis]|uniref:DUF4124 domain-containing protein n=1 Tax=Methylotenera versatilis TaxID=1055487 RepID=UPI0006468055|nr:DUF4124 domain-containing protein [Methylotenera versatilis]